MSLLVPILTTTDRNFSALATSYLVSARDMLASIAKRAALLYRKKTYLIVALGRPHIGQHVPHAIDKEGQLREIIRILDGPELGDFADARSSLLDGTRGGVVVLFRQSPTLRPRLFLL